MKVLPLPKAVVGGAKPVGSEALPFGPKNHSEGKLLGRRFVGVIVAEHTREAFPPAVLEPEGEMVTVLSMFTA